MPLSGWPTVPISLWARMRHTTPVEPWITWSAIRYLDRLVEPTWRVFEFGSGYSTPWLARRCAALTSLEHDPLWLERIRKLLASEGVDNVSLPLRSLDDFPKVITSHDDDSIDLVIVDGTEHGGRLRVECVEAARSKVRPGGHLMLDDSDTPAYRPVDSLLAGWQVRRFAGWRSFPLHAIETSFYSRPPSSLDH